jgi:cell division protein ZipA
MSSNIQLILLSIVGCVVLVTFVLSMRVRQKHQRLYQPPKEPVLNNAPQPQTTQDDYDIIPIQKKTKASESLSHQEDTRAYSELGFNELGDIFADHKPKPTQVAAPNSVANTKRRAIQSHGLVVLYLMAKQGQKFIGYELLQALLAAGLRFGDMFIFHRYQEPNGHGLVLFSLASATEPGTFDMNKMGAFACQGLTLFMNLTGPEHDLKALEVLLTTAAQLADDLQGVVLDERRAPIAPERIVQYQDLVKNHLAQLQVPQ